MTKQDYLELLVEKIHSTTIATIGADGHPQTRVIDMMLYDEQGVYFLTAKGKAFYAQLMEQGYIALSATKDKISISLRGKIKNISNEKLDEIFEKNTYTPVIIKYPFWQMTAKSPNAIYACINQRQAVCPQEIKKQSICIDWDIGSIINQIAIR